MMLIFSKRNKCLLEAIINAENMNMGKKEAHFTIYRVCKNWIPIFVSLKRTIINTDYSESKILSNLFVTKIPAYHFVFSSQSCLPLKLSLNSI